jgi:hypothetical protein
MGLLDALAGIFGQNPAAAVPPQQIPFGLPASPMALPPGAVEPAPGLPAAPMMPAAAPVAPSAPAEHWTGLGDDTRHTIAAIAASLSKNLGSPVGDAAQMMADKLGTRIETDKASAKDAAKRVSLAEALAKATGKPLEGADLLSTESLEDLLAKQLVPPPDPMVERLRKAGFSEDQIRKAIGIKEGLFPRAVARSTSPGPGRANPADPSVPKTRDQFINAAIFAARKPESPGGAEITDEERASIEKDRTLFVPPEAVNPNALVGQQRVALNTARTLNEAVDIVMSEQGVSRLEAYEILKSDPVFGPMIAGYGDPSAEEEEPLPEGLEPGWN